MKITGPRNENVDAVELNRLFKSVGFSPRSRSVIVSQIYTDSTFVAWDGSSIVGFGRGTGIDSDLFVLDVCVQPEYQGRGIGRQIVSSLVECAGDKYRSVKLVPKKGVEDFYRKLGFTQTSLSTMGKALRQYTF